MNPSFSGRSGPRRGGTRRRPNPGRRAEDPGVRDRSSKVAANRPRNRRCPRVVVPQVAPYPARAGASRSDIPIPTCSGKFPPGGSTSAARSRNARTRKPCGGRERRAGVGRSLGRGADDFCLSGRRRLPPQNKQTNKKCQARAQATSHCPHLCAGKYYPT